MSAMAECEVAMANPGVQAALPELNLMLARHGFEAEPLCWREGRVRGRHEDWRFRSVFQPVYRLQDGEPRLWSVEALARVSDRFGGQLIPTVLFAAETTPRRTVYVDRQLRCLHLLNFLLQSPPPGLLLSLNVNAQHLVNVSESHGQFFAEALQLLGVEPRHVCLEIVEDAVSDPVRLHGAVQLPRSGLLISLDDFGQGASNLERVWLLEPDYVKLDKVLMRRALMRPALRDKLTELVAILKLHGAKVVGEGIESEMQLDIARAAGCDFVQGFHLARPADCLNWPVSQASG